MNTLYQTSNQNRILNSIKTVSLYQLRHDNGSSDSPVWRLDIVNIYDL